MKSLFATVSVAETETVPSFAVILALAWAVTAFVEMANVAEEALAATFTLAGTVAELRLLLRLTLEPPVAASPANLTTPEAAAPPTTVVGLSVSSLRTAGSIFSVTPIDVEPSEAVIFADVTTATALVPTANVAEVAPPGIVTLAGAVAALLLLASFTTRPADGAVEPIFTAPIVPEPPLTLVGFTETDERLGASTVNVAEAELAPSVAVIFGVAFDATATVVTANVAVVPPVPTVTEAGVTAAEVEELSLTVEPLGPALAERVTVPFAEVPPTTFAGDKLSLDTFWAAVTLAKQKNRNATELNRLVKIKLQAMRTEHLPFVSVVIPLGNPMQTRGIQDDSTAVTVSRPYF